MTLSIDRRNVVRKYHGGGTILSALAELQNDLMRGVIQEVWVDHIYAECTNYNGWTVGIIYRDRVEVDD